MRLEGKVALVTGGASGIGAAIVERFRAEGAVALAADLRADDSPHALRLDVSDPQSCADAAGHAIARHGRLDIMVNCAGIARDIPFLDTPVEVFDQVIAINLRGTFLMGQAAARVMQPGAAIVNIASVSGMRGNVGRSAYGASKGGVVTLSQVMAADLAPLGIRVNVISPGPIETPMLAPMMATSGAAEWRAAVPLGRYGTPADVAAAATFLCSDEAAYVTGHIMAVDGGFLAAGLRRARN
jgi:NAD(P)-dependent dehydrogenase (short-subunit alcohol dehydrogenase family)